MNTIEVLKLIRKQAQWMREEGESDMRSIIWLADSLIGDIEAGKSIEEIMAKHTDADEE
jgi:hypothetical protein